MYAVGLIAASLAALLCVEAQSSACTTPNGASGECKSLYQCDDLLALINKQDRTPEDVALLQKSKCGFEGTTPKVCCPEPCYTPDGSAGKCVNIYSCPHLANMLKPPIVKENLVYVQNSKCLGTDSYGVCCGPSFGTTPAPRPSRTCKSTVSAFPPDPRTECCGVDSRVGNKITGGNATTVDQYPWLLIIEYLSKNNNHIKLLCGGVLISGRYALTAGHCVVGQVLNIGTPTNVRLGEYDTQNDGPDCAPVEADGVDCTEGTVIVPIEKTIPHPDYQPYAALKRNDIALLRLLHMAPYTEFIRPICLPSVDLTLTPPVNFTMYAAGWGKVSESQLSSNIKLQVGLPFVTMNECQLAYKAPGRNVNLWKGQLCAGGQPGKDSCKGDSGGPLMYENGRTFEVIGLVSFGPTPCGMVGIPGVYTKVHEYNTWIRNNIKP